MNKYQKKWIVPHILCGVLVFLGHRQLPSSPALAVVMAHVHVHHRQRQSHHDTHTHTHTRLTHTLTLSQTYALTDTLTHTRKNTLTHSHTYTLTHTSRSPKQTHTHTHSQVAPVIREPNRGTLEYGKAINRYGRFSFDWLHYVTAELVSPPNLQFLKFRNFSKIHFDVFWMC